MSGSAAALLERDAQHVWHPYAPAHRSSVFAVVEDARDCTLTLNDGTRTVRALDAMASWWCQIHGYHHPHLDAALHAQVERFSHVMFGGLSHAPAVDLADALVALTPEPLSRVFFADSGSVGMEVACKFARQVAIARAGGPTRRTKIAALRGAYHGDTLGVMALCDPVGGMHAMFAGAVPEQVFLPRPPAFGAGADDVAAWASGAAEVLDAHAAELCAIAVEPILQGAGGMWTWSSEALAWLRREATARGLLLIADEIATGLGRTSKLFACEWAGVVPDVLVLGKALTGGYLTQAAVLTTDPLAAELDDGPGGALMHGPTFMANPLACAAGLASLELLATGRWRTQVAAVEEGFRHGLQALRAHPLVADVRVLGAAAAIELTRPVDVTLATRVALDHQVWIRPFNHLIYALPPYMVTPDQVRQICAAMTAAVVAHEELS